MIETLPSGAMYYAVADELSGFAQAVIEALTPFWLVVLAGVFGLFLIIALVAGFRAAAGSV